MSARAGRGLTATPQLRCAVLPTSMPVAHVLAAGCPAEGALSLARALPSAAATAALQGGRAVQPDSGRRHLRADGPHRRLRVHGARGAAGQPVQRKGGRVQVGNGCGRGGLAAGGREADDGGHGGCGCTARAPACCDYKQVAGAARVQQPRRRPALEARMFWLSSGAPATPARQPLHRRCHHRACTPHTPLRAAWAWCCTSCCIARWWSPI